MIYKYVKLIFSIYETRQQTNLLPRFLQLYCLCSKIKTGNSTEISNDIENRKKISGLLKTA